MKLVYILLVLLITASALGCIGKNPSESRATPSQVSDIPENGDAGIESDLTQIDSLVNESAMEISLTEVSADAFT